MSEWFDGTENSVKIDRNKSGSMDCKMFLAYFEKEIVPYLRAILIPNDKVITGNFRLQFLFIIVLICRLVSYWMVTSRMYTTWLSSSTVIFKTSNFFACPLVKHLAYSRLMSVFLDC